MFQEGIRRLINVSPEVVETEKIGILAEYNNMMRVSGYDEAYRQEIIEGVLNRIEVVEGDIRAGRRVRYRDTQAIRREKLARQGLYNNT